MTWIRRCALPVLLAVMILTVVVPGLPPGQIPAAQAQEDACANAPAARLEVGGRGRVITGAERLRVREAAGLGGAPVTTLGDGQEFDVLDGPLCADGLRWWQIRTGEDDSEGLTGWIAEGSASVYFVTPVRAPAPTPDTADATCQHVPAPVGAIGDRVAVTFAGQPVESRTQPSLEAESLGQWWAGRVMIIVAGPECGSGLWWWRVLLPEGGAGWIPAGDSVQAYIEVIPPTPTSSPTFTPSATPTLTTTPSVTPSPTATETPLPSTTPIPSATPSATATPTHTVTPSITPSVTPSPTTTPTVTPTLPPTITALPTLTPSPTLDTLCWTSPRARLGPGMAGRVSSVDGLRLRFLPNADAGMVTTLRAGTAFTVDQGPLCNDGYQWYHVMLEDGSTTGWVAEGEGPIYWLEPQDFAGPTAADFCLAWSDSAGLHVATEAGSETVSDLADADVLALSVSSNGRFIALGYTNPADALIEIINLENGERTAHVPRERFSLITARNGLPAFVWAPDQRALLVNGRAASSAGAAVWAVSLYGEVTPLSLEGWQVAAAAPGSNRFGLVLAGGWGAGIYDLDAGRWLVTAMPDAAPAGNARTEVTWLADGTLAASFITEAAPGADSSVTYVSRLEPTTDHAAISPVNQPITRLAWSPDGNLIAYLLSGGLWLTDDVSNLGSILLPVGAQEIEGFSFAWAPTGQSLLYENPADPVNPRVVIDLTNGESIPVDPGSSDQATYTWAGGTLLLKATHNYTSRPNNQPTNESFWLLDPLAGTQTLLASTASVIFGTSAAAPRGCLLPGTP